MTTASKITLIRVAMIPLFMIVALWNFEYSEWFALIIFAIASTTDGIDGYIARKYNQVTDFGKFIDPLADKLLVMAAVIIFVEWNQMPSWAAMIIITRELAVTALRLVAVEGGIVIAAGWSGKVKTVCSIICICFMLSPLQSYSFGVPWLTINNISVAIMVITTVWSGTEYFYKNRKLLDVKK